MTSCTSYGLLCYFCVAWGSGLQFFNSNNYFCASWYVSNSWKSTLKVLTQVETQFILTPWGRPVSDENASCVERRESVEMKCYTVLCTCHRLQMFGCLCLQVNCVTVSNPNLISRGETVVNPGIKSWKETYLNELGVRKPLVVYISQRLSEELMRLYNLV
jgi:hypothetical protein